MRILLCGGTGFIGSALTRALLARGDEVWIVTRHAPKPVVSLTQTPTPRYLTWAEWRDHPEQLGTIDAIVNLAGETINQRWTDAAKQRIVQSRVDAAQAIADNVLGMDNPPDVVINASGISLYGHSGEQIFDERDPAMPADFLGETVVLWEAAADQIPAKRLVKLRIGLVLAADGGAFPLLRLPYRLFVGGHVGSGRQGLPWIHLQDMVGLILFCMDHETISGCVNAVAPEPVSNDAFGRVLGNALQRPHWFHVPAPMLKLLLGEMSTLVLTGQKAMPSTALAHGFKFAYPKLQEALRDLTR